MNNLINLLKEYAPQLATAAGGPLAGLVVSQIAQKLGVEATPSAVTAAIQADPQVALKLAEIDLEQFKAEMQNTSDARKMNSEIQASENASWLAKNIAYTIDIAIIAGALFITFIVFVIGVPDNNKAMAFSAFGSLWTLAGTVVNFHRGSSSGSKAKTDELLKAAK